MSEGDFFANEQSVTIETAGSLRIEHEASDGTLTVLKEAFPVQAGEIVDATFMSKTKLTAFLNAQIADAKQAGVLFSLHMKATMMKVSDPIIFGHAVKAYFSEVFDKHGDVLEAAGVNVNNGFGSLVRALDTLSAEDRAGIEATI